MPIYNVECYSCGEVEEDVWLKIEESPSLCSSCNGIRFKHVGCSHFILKYDNKRDVCDWDGNSSMYWNDVKAARARGEDVH